MGKQIKLLPGTVNKEKLKLRHQEVMSWSRYLDSMDNGDYRIHQRLRAEYLEVKKKCDKIFLFSSRCDIYE